MSTNQILALVFEIVILPLLGVLTKFAINWLNAKANQIKEKTKSDLIDTYIDRLNDIISTTVVAVQQTYVEALKKKGEFNIDAQKAAFQLAFDSVKGSLTDEALSLLTDAIGDLDDYITNGIEYSVLMNKNSNE